MTARFNCFVPGVPISQGSKKLVQPRGHSRPLMIDANPKLKAWRKAMHDTFAWLAKIHKITEPMDGPIGFAATFWIPSPKGNLRVSGMTKRHYADTAYDLDKLTRAAWDSLKTAGVIRDDARICLMREVSKKFCNKGQEPGVHVELWPINETEMRGGDHIGQEALREVPRAEQKGSGEEASEEEVTALPRRA